ncbi:hypothetical protein C5167_030329 [Papaver somniferum]|nr:hypothetical protein C5167_030329 [Papaver somniferum]
MGFLEGEKTFSLGQNSFSSISVCPAERRKSISSLYATHVKLNLSKWFLNTLGLKHGSEERTFVRGICSSHASKAMNVQIFRLRNVGGAANGGL